MEGGLPLRGCFSPFPPEMAVPSFPAQSNGINRPQVEGQGGQALGSSCMAATQPSPQDS